MSARTDDPNPNLRQYWVLCEREKDEGRPPWFWHAWRRTPKGNIWYGFFRTGNFAHDEEVALAWVKRHKGFVINNVPPFHSELFTQWHVWVESGGMKRPWSPPRYDGKGRR